MNEFRDVTPNKKSDSMQNPKEVLRYIFDYLKNPMQKIKTLPNWNWTTLVASLIAISMISGTIAGFIPPNFLKILSGLIISPMVAIVTTFLGALFTYYYFQVFEKRTCSLRKIYTLILFADIPFFIFQTGSEVIPPIGLLGFAFTSMLMAVGLSENFNMEKRRAMRLVSLMFGTVFLIWLYNKMDFGGAFIAAGTCLAIFLIWLWKKLEK